MNHSTQLFAAEYGFFFSQSFYFSYGFFAWENRRAADNVNRVDWRS